LINWKVRFKNRAWVIAFISQGFILIQVVLTLLNTFGVTDYQLTEQIKSEILTVVNTVFILLSMLGVIQDPTTKGVGDSERAKSYTEPN
jgi:phi LC3 family holin